MAKFEIFKDKEDKFRFRLKSVNGQTIIASQGYTRKNSCLNGITSVKNNSQDNTNFERLRSNDGRSYFNLIAKNKLVIATSQMYFGSKAMEQGIGSVKKNAITAKIIEIKVKTILS
jgi:uncharacterized protein YegP (UPF0339 family)